MIQNQGADITLADLLTQAQPAAVPVLNVPKMAVAGADTAEAMGKGYSVGEKIGSTIGSALGKLILPFLTPPQAPAAGPSSFNIPPSLAQPTIGSSLSNFSISPYP